MRNKPFELSLAALVIVGIIGASGCGSSQPTRGESKPLLSYTPKSHPTTTPIEAEITPSARGCQDTSGAYLVGSFIYWNSSYTDMVISALNQGTVDNTHNRKISMGTDYDPGFKLGWGYNFEHDDWDLFLNWTWLKSRPRSSQHKSSPVLETLLSDLVTPTNSVEFAEQFHAKWHFDFNALDLEMGRDFCVSSRLSLRPFAGLKSAWIRQKLNISYQNLLNEPSPQVGVFKDHMFGIGPRLGMNSRWVFGSCNFAFLANIAGSLIWEEFSPYSNVDYIDSQGNPPNIATMKGRQKELNPIAEVFLGFDWGHCFKNDVYFNLSAGYEMQYWWDQNKTSSQIFYLQGNHALNLHGLTTSVRVDF